MKQLANLAPLCKIANKNKANAFNFINALIKVCKASKVIKKDPKYENKSIKSPQARRSDLENESDKQDHDMSDVLSPSKSNSLQNEMNTEAPVDFGNILKDLHCTNNFSETQASYLNSIGVGTKKCY
jgi:hypothetical protein